MDSFKTYERADEMIGVYQQQDQEKKMYGYDYEIQTSTFYDE